MAIGPRSSSGANRSSARGAGGSSSGAARPSRSPGARVATHRPLKLSERLALAGTCVRRRLCKPKGDRHPVEERRPCEHSDPRRRRDGSGAPGVGFRLTPTGEHDAGLGVGRPAEVLNLRKGVSIGAALAPGRSVDRGLSFSRAPKPPSSFAVTSRASASPCPFPGSERFWRLGHDAPVAGDQPAAEDERTRWRRA